MLPSAEMLEASGRSCDGMRTLIVDGAPVLLDKLGPVIVTREGRLTSIENWHLLSKDDRVLAMRKLGKRNQERLAALRAQALADDIGGGMDRSG